MIKIDFINARRFLNIYVSSQVLDILGDEDHVEKLDAIKQKYTHTFKVVTDGMKVLEYLEFNESTADFSKIALMNHDIGRFSQMKLTGTYDDTILSKTLGIKNHGVLGKQVLDNLITSQLPNMEIFYNPIKQIVNDHVDKVNTDEELTSLSSGIFKNYSMEEILNSKDERISQNAIGTITQIVQDVDRVDIYHQLLDGRWIPKKSDEPINPQIFKSFYNGEYLNIKKLKEQGLWNVNVGELVRLSFINQVKLLSVAKLIQKENIIMRLKEIRQNPYANDAFDYINDKLNQMIKNSTDGITVGKVR